MGRTQNIRELLRARKADDPVCQLLDVVAGAKQNRHILLRCLGCSAERCYPAFDTMGTVTGRILATDPSLQHLKKMYRGVLRAEKGRKLIYLDYAQFEPSIMAAVSGDPSMQALCVEEDLYRRLAKEVFGDAEHRKSAKLLFLAYAYGMRISALPDLLAAVLPERQRAEEAIRTNFLPLFTGIEDWKRNINSQLASDGRIGTMLGNHRYRTASGDLLPDEERWAVNQIVQGTGSLILKKFINELAGGFPNVAILLPMHDALLVEVPEDNAKNLTAGLLLCARKAFSDICPSVLPIVREKPFGEAAP